MRKPLEVFVSYSHKDETLKDELLEHLGTIERFNTVAVYSDSNIEPGAVWLEEIELAMARADIALLLVSAPFLSSEFIQKTEVPRLLQRQKDERVVVIPVLLRECAWRKHRAISSLQMLPKTAKPIGSLSRSKRDQAFTEVVLTIAELAKDREGRGTKRADREGARRPSGSATGRSSAIHPRQKPVAARPYADRAHSSGKPLRLAEPEKRAASSVKPEPYKLRLITAQDEVRANMSSFQREASAAPEMARGLLRQTTYWVHDPGSDAFGPAKYVGYRAMKLDRYAEARAGRLTGDRFDGHITRAALEGVLGREFAHDTTLASKLVRWGEALIGKGAFGDANPAKWSFATMDPLIASVVRPEHREGPAEQAYREIRDARGSRPTASELFRVGDLRSKAALVEGGWFNFVNAERDLSKSERRVLRAAGEWLFELEKTSISRCFKMITLEALIEADQLFGELSIEELAKRSHSILLRSPDLLMDLPERFRDPESLLPGSPSYESNLRRFTTYWKTRPIDAWTSGGDGRWFAVECERFISMVPRVEGDESVLVAMTQELIDYRLARYRARSHSRREGA